VNADKRYPTASEWRSRFDAIPQHIRTALYEQALSASPYDGMRGVPISWAAVTYETILRELRTLLNHVDGHLGLAIYRHDNSDEWKQEAARLIIRIRTMLEGEADEST
jgi:hypothetical protein